MIALLRRVALLGVVLVLAIALWNFWGARRPDYGTTTGAIIVSSPEVYSRERLVNDRFQEATWLGSELHDIDKLYWGTQASVSTSHRDSNRLGIDAGQQPEGPKPGSPGGVDSTAPAPTPGSISQLPQEGSGDGHAQSSPIERFRDRVAYREEVRAASLETQLDDRHDIAGNTLYRVKFSITILPEQDTSAWALVYVELAGTDDSVGAKKDVPEHCELEAASDHAMTTLGPPDMPAAFDTYCEWLHYYEGQLNDELDRLSDSTTRYPEKFTDFSGYVATALRKQACKDETGPDCTRGLELRTMARQALLEASERKRNGQCTQFEPTPGGDFSAKGFRPCSAAELDSLQAQCDSSSISGNSCLWKVSNYQRLDALLQEYRAVRYSAVPEEYRPRPRQFFRLVTAEYLQNGLEQHNRHNLWVAHVVDCDLGMCRIKLEDGGNGAADRFAEATRAGQVFAYAVSPKESVQRIANLASSQRERQLALGASLKQQLTPNLLTTVLQQGEKDDSLLQAVMRKPLVVGFAPPGARSAAKKQASEDVAAFGWIIGPRFDIGEGSTPRFRHAASENDVSAIISVPSWWKSATIAVSTCWVDERRGRSIPAGGSALDLTVVCRDKHDEVRQLIRLPGHPNEIARRLGLKLVRRPSVSSPTVTTVEACQPADILIEGTDLWRSTLVTLNDIPADNIIVLPDMQGIVAHFNKIARLPPGPQDAQREPNLRVFTSEGTDFAGTISVVERSPVPASCARLGADAGDERQVANKTK